MTEIRRVKVKHRMIEDILQRGRWWWEGEVAVGGGEETRREVTESASVQRRNGSKKANFVF